MQKLSLRSCAKTLMGKHDSSDQHLACLYKDQDKANQFVKKMINSIGIKLTTMSKRIGPSNNRKRNNVVSVSVYDVALLFAMKGRIRESAMALMPYQLCDKSLKLSSLDKEWVKNSIKIYNDACSYVGCEEKNRIRK